jgi:four helix bundle protein
MATFRRFEDILAWQKARELTRQIYEATKTASFARDYGLCDQIRRSSVSVMGNIAEGFGRNSDKEFANFLNISLGSTTETQLHLYVALDQSYIDQNGFTGLYDRCGEINRMLKSLAQTLRHG